MVLQHLPKGKSLISPRGPTGPIPVKWEGKRCFLPSGMGLQTVPVVVLAAMDSGLSSQSVRAEDVKTPNFHKVSKSMHFQQDDASPFLSPALRSASSHLLMDAVGQLAFLLMSQLSIPSGSLLWVGAHSPEEGFVYKVGVKGHEEDSWACCVSLSRVCAILQPPSARLGVNQTEKEKGFGPNHSWGMNVSILCRDPCLSRCGTRIPENHKGMDSLVVL